MSNGPTEEELRAECASFREDCARDLTAIELEYADIPSFKEWKEGYRNA
jgi:hypothetical protein